MLARRLLFIASAVLLLTSCVKYENPSERRAREAEAMDAKDRIAGWLVRCVDEKATASTTCFVEKSFPQCKDCYGVPFRVTEYLRRAQDGNIQQDRVVHPGNHSETWENPTVRVDNNHPTQDMRSEELLRQLVTGKTAFAKYYRWPYGGTTMEADLSGLPQAIARLDELVRIKKAEITRN